MVEQRIGGRDNVSGVFGTLLDDRRGIRLGFAPPVTDREHRSAFAHISSGFVECLRQCDLPFLLCHFLHSIPDINNAVTNKGKRALDLR